MSRSTVRAVECLCVALLASIGCCYAVECPTAVEREPGGVVFAEVGSCVLLNCSASLPVAWYKNSIPVPPSSRQTFTSEGDLRFDAVLSIQAGWYTCVASTAQQDFLLIVGTRPTAMDTVSYNVVGGSRVELGCVGTGSPPPRVIWRDGHDDQVLESGSLRVDPTSNSLIIDNYTMAHMQSGGYFCQLSNDFGVVNATRTDIAITSTTAPVYTSPLEDDTTPIFLPLDRNTPLRLFCTGLDIQSTNITVQWFKDYKQMPGKTNDRLTVSNPPPQPSDAGYYCCNVHYLDQQINRHCITVWVGESSQFSSILPPTTLALPSNRQPLLPCAAVERTYDTPLVSWQRDGHPLTNSIYAQNSSGLNYVRVEGVGVYTCTITNSVNSRTASFSVTSAEPCSEGNVVEAGDASNGSLWTASNGNARVDTINNEQVFVLDYSINGTNLSQTLERPHVISLQMSARVRQTSPTPSQRGLATVTLLTSQGLVELTNPDNVSQAWQWVGVARDFPQPVDLLTVQLLVDGGVSGVAYFDNVCVSVVSASPVLDTQLVIIGASVGGGVVLLLLLTLCLVCCIVSRKKKQSSMMKKMSVKMTSAISNGTGGEVSLHGYTETPDRLYDSIRRDADYVNPDNYQYIDPQEIPRPHNSDAQYAALDPKSLDQHVYMTATPMSHRSTASLHVMTEEEAAAGYLQVLPSSMPTDNDIYENDTRRRCVTSPAELEHETNLYECVEPSH